LLLIYNTWKTRRCTARWPPRHATLPNSWKLPFLLRICAKWTVCHFSIRMGWQQCPCCRCRPMRR